VAVFQVAARAERLFRFGVRPISSRSATARGTSTCSDRARNALNRVTFLWYFVCILLAALGSAAIGGIFAAFVALISPEFVKGLFPVAADGSLTRYAAAVGMIWGVFIGAAAMAFSLALVTMLQVAKVLKKKSEEEPKKLA
jgi:hypothetical protein